MPPTKSAAEPRRKERNASFFLQCLRNGLVTKHKEVDFEANLKVLFEMEEQASELEAKMKTILSKAGGRVRNMFKRTTGGEETLWSIHREIVHRIEFLKVAQAPKNDRMLFTGGDGSEGEPFDQNLDKLMDFVMHTGETSLKGISVEDFKARCDRDKWGIYMDAESIFTYLCDIGGTNRRTRWDLKHTRDKERERPNPQPGRSKYASNRIEDHEKNTSVFGRYDKDLDKFVPWTQVDPEAMRPFQECVSLLVRHETLASDDIKRMKDSLQHKLIKTADKKRVSDKDRVYDESRGNRGEASFPFPTKRSCGADAIVQRAVNTAPDPQRVEAFNRFHALNIQRFQQEWSTVQHLAYSWGFHACLNMICSFIRNLKDTECMVFSMPGSTYKPVTDQHRRLDDHVSYASPLLTKLICEYGLTDQDVVGHRTVGGSVCKLLHNDKMKEEGLPEYVLKPFAFIFDCERATLRLTSATDFFNTNSRLFIGVRDILAQAMRAISCPIDELYENMKDPTHHFFGEHKLHPIMTLEFDVRNLEATWLTRRASLQEMQEPDFPFKSRIFAFARLEEGVSAMHDGNRFYVKYPGRGWALANPDGSDIELSWPNEKKPDNDTEEVESSEGE